MTKRFPFALTLCLSGFCLFSHDVSAQQISDPLLEEQRQNALEARTNALGAMTEGTATPEPGPPQARIGPCFDIAKIDVEGVTLFSEQTIQNITSKYAARCLQGADIQELIRSLNSLYADRGYITSRTYIPAQNLKDGTLALSVLEGKVEDILLTDGKRQLQGKRAQRLLGTAFPHAKGGLFQLRDFEQGLDQMNRLRSVDAKLQLQPGSEPGGSYVVIQRLQQDRIRGWLRLDNLGSKSTGRNEISLDLEADDLLGANDTWTLGYAGTVNTNALSLDGSLPYGAWTYGVNLGYSEYLNPLTTSAELFGTTVQGGLSARWMAKRDQFTTTELSFGLNLRRGDRYINSVALTPQQLTTVDIGLTHMRLSETARNSVDIGLRLGLPIFGADRDISNAAAGTPKAQVLILNFGWQRQAALGSLGTMVNDLRAQYSPNVLYGSQQISFGSYSTVRAYGDTEGVGDSGFYMRNDLYLAPDIWQKAMPKKLGAKLGPGFQPFLFADFGMAWDRGRHTRETAASAGIGLSWFHDRFTLGAQLGVPLVHGNRLVSGDPLFQVRLDVKAW